MAWRECDIRFTVDIPKEIHNEIKIIAAQRKTTMKEIVNSLLRQLVTELKETNDEQEDIANNS
jgi:predicted HicB family RNase H-like nuclease